MPGSIFLGHPAFKDYINELLSKWRRLVKMAILKMRATSAQALFDFKIYQIKKLWRLSIGNGGPSNFVYVTAECFLTIAINGIVLLNWFIHHIFSVYIILPYLYFFIIKVVLETSLIYTDCFHPFFKNYQRTKKYNSATFLLLLLK